ncbi:hypothetical protein EVAR_100812_1 [Eumeta japonica]|uniref:Uncharacterized protein n=1 Tax=Eumeta variegata TaxID=151549 RepID=A0A4C2A9Q9_EUMVA|nr:hypothetical protein EVAR_100812_1 [Eumeta japonica]
MGDYRRRTVVHVGSVQTRASVSSAHIALVGSTTVPSVNIFNAPSTRHDATRVHEHRRPHIRRVIESQLLAHDTPKGKRRTIGGALERAADTRRDSEYNDAAPLRSPRGGRALSMSHVISLGGGKKIDFALPAL